MKKEKKYNKSDVFNCIFIIIIIILLLLLLMQCSRKEKKYNKTGNVDIFEINCNRDDSCDVDTQTKIINDDKTDINVKKDGNIDVSVSDKYITWQQTNKLNIFENPMYDMSNKLAPTSTNSYEFKIKNNIDADTVYSLTFEEVNKYDIDMRYKLKKENRYIVDEWVKYNELNLDNMKLGAYQEDTYYLEWKWFEGENDTYAGEQSGIGYTLNIDMKAYVDD